VVVIINIGEDPKSSRRNAFPEAPAISEKIQNIIETNSLEVDKKRNIKITYSMYISHNEFFSLSEDEAKELLRAAYYRAPNRNCCERSFLSVYVRGLGISPAVLHDEGGKLSLTTSSWESYQCGLKTALNHLDVIKKAVQKFYDETTILALNFIDTYNQGYDLSKLQKKAERINNEWDNNEFYKLLPTGCFSVFPAPYGEVKTKALSLVLQIDDTRIAEKITPFDITQIAKQYQETITAGLRAGF